MFRERSNSNQFLLIFPLQSYPVLIHNGKFAQTRKVKKLHSFLIRSYIPPFIMTLFIGMFIFFIIFVFVYIDEIAGKGISTWDLIQLLFYTFISNLPKSAPLAVLLSSIMTMGNLAERYEMAAMKSAGLSLFRIMMPLIIFIFFLSIGTFLFSNYTMPYIQLKGGRLLWDIRQSKPSFNIKEGIYYNGLDDYRIRVNKKEEDGETVKGIYIADHTEGLANNVQVIADSGKIRMTEDKNYLEINIFGGTQYRHILRDEKDNWTRPYVRMGFREQEIKIDLTELKMQNTAEELFKNNYQMLTLVQLQAAIDSIKREEAKFFDQIKTQFTKNFTSSSQFMSQKTDSLKDAYVRISDHLKLFDKAARSQIISRASESATSSQQYLESMLHNDIKTNTNKKLLHMAEWHKKLTLPIACIVLFFVGAPLGAIVRKGGLGMPVVISVLMFLLFHVFSTTFEKSFLEGALDVFTGLWAPTFIFLPLGIWLSWMAANDSAIFDKSSYQFITKLFRKKK
jgi:lipopolysaccharide export system permease protein